MSKTKKIVIAVISVILVLILAGVMYVVFKTGSLKKVSSLTDIKISISEQSDTDKNSPYYGKTYLLQQITVKNASAKDIILQCNTNEDATSFVGLNYLDKIGNESESDNVYTVLYVNKKPYTYENRYYFSTAAQKETILKELNRDYTFKLYIYHVNNTLYGTQTNTISVPAKDYVLKEVPKESIGSSLRETEKKIALSLKGDLTKDYDIIKYNEKLYSAYDKSGREFKQIAGSS